MRTCITLLILLSILCGSDRVASDAKLVAYIVGEHSYFCFKVEDQFYSVFRVRCHAEPTLRLGESIKVYALRTKDGKIVAIDLYSTIDRYIKTTTKTNDSYAYLPDFEYYLRNQ